MAKIKIKIRLGNKGSTLTENRKELLDQVTFPFIFLDEDENEISKEEEPKKI